MKHYAIGLAMLLITGLGQSVYAADTQSVEQSVYLQMGAYQNQHYAEQQVADLALLGIDALVQTVSVEQGNIYRVRTHELAYGKAQEIAQYLYKHNVQSVIMNDVAAK